MNEAFVGCAGWSLPRSRAEAFPGSGSHLQRYSNRFSAVEINSSFYRPHLQKTYARWAASVPLRFRFAVKVPREITHYRRLVKAEAPLTAFLSEAGTLGEKLGPLLIQLPPGLKFTTDTVRAYLDSFRSLFAGSAVCEPRHATWFTSEVEELLNRYHIARVAADPAIIPAAGSPGGWTGISYYRLHGSPRMYYSSYSEEYLARLADELRTRAAKSEVWCIFDNTAEGAALENALTLLRYLGSGARRGQK